MLLSCSKSYASNLNDSILPTGEILLSDTTITISIDYIRLANAKMIERNYLLNITNEQDSIIFMKDKYINEQTKIITDFQKRVSDANKINEAVRKDLEKQKRRTKIIGWSAGAAIIGVIVGIIAK